MRDNGNVGIGTGTSVPTDRLHVVGNLRVTGVIFGNVSGTITQEFIAAKQITLAGLGTSQPRLISDGAIQVTGSIRETSGSLGFTTPGDLPLPVKVGSLVVSNNYGDSAPTNGIYVAGAVTIGGTQQIIPNASVHGGSRTLRFVNGTSLSNEGFEFYNGVLGTSLVMIQQNGNVGIGKNNPGARLDVSGNINASGGIVAGGSVNCTIDVNVGNNATVENDVWAKGAIFAGSGNRRIADSSGCYYA